MGQLVEEVRIWNTPVVGAFLLWRFTKSYIDNHPHGDAPIALKHFIAMAILTNENLLEPVRGSRDGLASYARCFEDNRKSDILTSIHERILLRRDYTLASIDIGVSQGLLVWDADQGKLYPRDLAKKPARGKNPKASIEKYGKKADILGAWFSQCDLPTIATYLKVVL